MRGYVILTISIIGALWALDAYKFDGRYSQDLLQQANDQGRNFSDGVQHWLNKAMSGH
jgi:hypothetical protein